MFLREFFEAVDKADAAFAFGRFNPAHQGHVEVYKAVEAAGEKWFIGTNPNTHGANDPLTFEEKSAWMSTIYPGIKGHIIPEQSVLTVASKLYEMLGDGKSIAYVTDTNDWAWSGKLLNDYNGKQGPHGYYNFKTINHVESPRVSSATALRTAARAGDESAFYAASGTDPKLTVNGKTYYETVVAAVNANPEKVKKAAKKKTEKPGSKFNDNPNDDWSADFERRMKQGVAEGGMMKSIQRGLKGWQGSSHLDDIQDYIRNASDKTLVRLYKEPGESPYKKTPRDIQIKLINRELKRRYGVKPGEQGVAEVTGDKSFDDIMRQIKKGTKKQATADRKAEREESRKRARDAFGPNPFASLSIRKKDVEESMYDTGFKIGNWEYRAEVEDDDDVTKTFHYAIKPNGGEISIDFSPYSTMTKETFKLWVKAGMPTRKDLGKRGPLDNEDIIELSNKGKDNVIPHMAKDLENPPKVMQHRAKRDQERDQQLKSRDIAKKDSSEKDEWGELKDSLRELSSEILGKYKKKASADATDADKKGDYKHGDKRYSGIIKATKKQFANDLKDKKSSSK
jgi:hypothetical protein